MQVSDNVATRIPIPLMAATMLAGAGFQPIKYGDADVYKVDQETYDRTKREIDQDIVMAAKEAERQRYEGRPGRAPGDGEARRIANHRAKRDRRRQLAKATKRAQRRRR